MKFIFFSEYGETLDLAIYLNKVKGHDVLFHVEDKHSRGIGRGIIPLCNEWFQLLGQNFVWVFDSCSFGAMQDWLRQRGEVVFGGCSAGDELENNRQLNQEWFKELGFKQPFSKNFTSIEDAMGFVQSHSKKRWILKQNGDAPKSINHLGKFKNSVDMLYHLGELKKIWNEQQFGQFNCDLMEVVTGLEVAASAFFNGNDFLRNEDGRIVGFLNFEEKKESDGGLGETCGEMGTTFVGVDDSNNLFHSIICRAGIAEKLRSIGFHGVFDINCIVGDSEDEIVALEPTMRFGIPATSYEMIEGMVSDPGVVIDACARGLSQPIEIYAGVGMVMCVVAKPFPIEADVEDVATSLGEKLWILDPKTGQPSDGFSEDQMEHIHLYNFEYTSSDEDDEDGCFKVVTKNGYLFTVTGRGKSIADARESLIEYIKSNVYIAGNKWRSDIGARIEEFESDILGE